jgi:hypothetical protein
MKESSLEIGSQENSLTILEMPDALLHGTEAPKTAVLVGTVNITNLVVADCLSQR